MILFPSVVLDTVPICINNRDDYEMFFLLLYYNSFFLSFCRGSGDTSPSGCELSLVPLHILDTRGQGATQTGVGTSLVSLWFGPGSVRISWLQTPWTTDTQCPGRDQSIWYTPFWIISTVSCIGNWTNHSDDMLVDGG